MRTAPIGMSGTLLYLSKKDLDLLQRALNRKDKMFILTDPEKSPGFGVMAEEDKEHYERRKTRPKAKAA